MPGHGFHRISVVHALCSPELLQEELLLSSLADTECKEQQPAFAMGWVGECRARKALNHCLQKKEPASPWAQEPGIPDP